MQYNNNILGQPIGFSLSDWKSLKLPSGEPMEGNFCRLERLNPSLHAASLYAANMIDVEGRMWTYLPYGPFNTLDNYYAWTEEICRNSDPLFYAIIDRATDQALGIASYLRIDPEIGSIEVGHISYSRLLQRTPAATEAMFLILLHCL